MVVKITDKMKFSRSFDYVDNGIEHGVLSKFEPKEILLKKGTLIAEGFKPLDCDIKMLKDVPVKLRDGVTIYTDIYLPNKIGCLTNFDFSKLYDLIEQFKTQYPNVKFIIEQGSPMELNDGLLNRTYDLVLNLDNYISNNDVLKTSLYKNNNLQVAIQNNHRLASKQEIQFSDLTDETLILIERNKSPLVFDYVINQCLKHGFHAKANYYVKNLDEGLSKTSLGEGISFLYSGMDNGYLSKKYRVKFLNLNEEKSSQNLVYAFQENNNPMLDEFLNFVHQNRSDLY